MALKTDSNSEQMRLSLTPLYLCHYSSSHKQSLLFEPLEFFLSLLSGSKSPGLGAGFQVPMQSGGDGDGDGSQRGASAAAGGSLNEQIVVALARLQDDMQSVLERLHTLEALTASQVRQAHGHTQNQTFFYLFIF